MSKHEKLAKEILSAVGGLENINEVRHCVTRLRLTLKDKTKANDDEVKQIKGVMKVVKAGGQYQVVIGNEVPTVYKEFIKLTGFKPKVSVDANEDEKLSTYDKIFQVVQGIFVPIIFLMAAAGIIMGVNSLLQEFGIIARYVPGSGDGGTARLLSIISQGIMQGLPVIIGWSAIKVFGGSELLGVAMGLIMIHPFTTATAASQWEQIYGEWTRTTTHHFFGFIPVIFPRTGYVGTVIPIIGAVFVVAKLEISFTKILPQSIRAFFVPLLSLLIGILATFVVIGPMATLLTDAMASGITTIFNIGGGVGAVLAGFVIGGLWQVMVVFGIHHAIPPIALILLLETGADHLLVLTTATSFTQFAAALAVTVKTKNKELREIGIPACVGAFIGVTEPVIFGVNLPQKKPFVIANIVSAFGGAFIGLMGVARYRQGGWGILFITSSTPGDVQAGHIDEIITSWNSAIWLLVAWVASTIIAFFATYFLWKEEPFLPKK